MFKAQRNGNLHAITANIPNKSISLSSFHLKRVEWQLQQNAPSSIPSLPKRSPELASDPWLATRVAT
jgi:hypothetical protein